MFKKINILLLERYLMSPVYMEYPSTFCITLRIKLPRILATVSVTACSH